MPKLRQYAVYVRDVSVAGGVSARTDDPIIIDTDGVDTTSTIPVWGDGLITHTGDHIDLGDGVYVSAVNNAGIIAALRHRLTISNLPIVG